MNQETALNIVIGIATRSPEVTACKSSKTLKELQQAIRVCQTLADNRAAKRSWRESCGHGPIGFDPHNMPDRSVTAMRAKIRVLSDPQNDQTQPPR